MRRKAAIQLALHAAVIAKLKADPSIPYVEFAERTIDRMRSAVRGPSMGALPGHVGRADQRPV